jgi:ribosomal protein S17
MKQRGMKRQLIGTVVSNKAEKTATVLVERLVKHQIYLKYVRRRTKFAAHDAGNDFYFVVLFYIALNCHHDLISTSLKTCY